MGATISGDARGGVAADARAESWLIPGSCTLGFGLGLLCMYWLDACDEVEGGREISRPIDGSMGRSSDEGVETKEGSSRKVGG